MLADLVVSTGRLSGGEESFGTGPPTALPALCCPLCCAAAVVRREREDVRALPRPTVFLVDYISPHSVMQCQGTFPLAYKVPGKWESLGTADSDAVDKSHFFFSPPHLHIFCLNITSVSTISASKRCVRDGGSKRLRAIFSGVHRNRRK